MEQYYQIQQMIKGIIEKVIVNYFGKFIKGIEKENLHVDLLGGNFKLENINLNNQFFDNLQVPIKLAYSSIGKLNMQVPLSKISSVPVECILDNIFIIFQFKEDLFSDIQKNNTEKKRKAVQKYAKETLQEFLNKLKEDKKEEGMVGKMGMKIIDNLQLKLINFHVRFQQNTKDKKYAWGITFQEIQFITTDQKWKPSFIDRSIEANRNAILYKTMNVKNFSIYWNSKDVKLFKKSANNLILDRMSKIITQKNEQRILSITSQFKLIINPLNKFDKPIYQLSILLQPIQIEFGQGQVSQIIDFAQKIILQNEIRLMSKKKMDHNEVLAELKTKFQKYMFNYLEELDIEEDQQQYQSIVTNIYEKIDADQLLLWSTAVVKNVIKLNKIDDMKKKKKGKWFSSNKQTIQLTAAQIKQLQQLIENTFQNETKLLRPQSLPYFSVVVDIPSGKFIFVKQFDTIKQKLQFSLNKIYFDAQKSQDDSNFETKVTLKAVNFDFITTCQNKQKRINVFRNVSNTKQKNQYFLKLHYVKKLEKQIQSVNTTVSLEKLICVYRALFLKKFTEFFKFRSIDQIMKSATLEKFEKISDQTQQKLNLILQKKNQVEIFISSPTLLIPFDDNTQMESECWVWNFGNLMVKSEQKTEDPSFKEYQFFNIKLQQVNLQYYPSIKLCYDVMQKNTTQIVDPNIFSVINDLNFDILLRERRNFIDPEKHYKSIVNIKLPTFSLKFNQKQYENLINLQKIFNESDRNYIEILKNQKIQIQKFKVHEGYIKKKNETVKNWFEYYAILSGAYIYFYKSKKQLKFVEKVYIKNSKIQIKDSCLEITNRYQKCHLEFENEFQLLKWKEIIELKIKEYATNIQLIEIYDKQDQKETETKYQKKLMFNFQLNNIDFTYQNIHKVELINFKIINLKIEKSSQTSQQTTSLVFQEFYIEDKIFIYQNKEYQPLIEIGKKGQQKTIIKYYKNQEGMIKGLKSSENLKINIRLPQVKLNWKPDALLLIIDMIKKYLGKNTSLTENDFQIQKSGQKIDRSSVLSDIKQDYRFSQINDNHENSDIKVKNNRQSYLSMLAYSKIKQSLDVLVNLDFEVDSINIYMMHRQTHVILFHMVSEKLFLNLMMTENEKFVDGYLTDLIVYQMTGYPATSDSNLQYKQIIPYRIFQRKPNNNETIFKFKWSSFDEKYFINKERVNSFCYLKVSPCEYHYFQQVTFRIIDYILIQVMLLIENPDMVLANQNLLTQLKQNKQIHEKPVYVWGEYEEIAKRLTSPFFSDIFLELGQTSLVLKAQRHSDIYFIGNLQGLTAENIKKRNPRRFQKEQVANILTSYIWEQEYLINIKQIQFQIIEDNVIRNTFTPIDLHMNVNRLLNEDQIKYIFPELSKYDRGFHIKTKSTEIKLVVNKFQYLQIIKLLNFNMTYDDERDELFIHNYKITKLLEPKEINFIINFPKLEFIATLEQQQAKRPLFGLNIQDMQIFYKRSKRLDSCVTISTPKMRVNQYDLKQQATPLLMAPQTSSKKQITKLVVDMKNTGQKICTLYVDSAKIICKINIFFCILEWVDLVDYVFPVQSSYVNQILFFTNINNVVIALQSASDSKHAFAALGTLSYKYSRKKNRTEDFYRNQLLQGKMNKNEFDQLPEASFMSLSLNVQLFRCKYENFVDFPFEKVPKRVIVYPVTFNYSDKKHLKISNLEKFDLKSCSNKTINIDRAISKISFRDLMMLQKMMEEQKKHQDELVRVLKIIKKNTHINKKQQSPVKRTISEESSIDNFYINAEILGVYIINNCGQSFVPVINFNLEQMRAHRILTLKKQFTQASFSCNLNYFNGGILKWQPFLEKTIFNINHNTYFTKQNRQSRYLSIESNNQLLLNFSKQLVAAISSTAEEWNQANSMQIKDINIRQEEPIQLVSHYIIINETGYPLEILDTNKMLKAKLQPNSRMTYDVQHEDYDMENQNIIVNVRIVHPRTKYLPIQNINLNSNRIKKVFLKYADRKQPCQQWIVLKPQYSNSKQYYYIATPYYILDNTNNLLPAITKPLLFDQDIRNIEISFPEKITINMQKITKTDMETTMYRYMLKHRNSCYTVKISHKFTAINLLPIPIDINGVKVPPSKSTGFTGELYVNREKISKTYYKIINKKNQVYIYCQAYIVDYFGLDWAFSQITSPKPIHSRYFYQKQLKDGQIANIMILPNDKEKMCVKLRDRKKFIKGFQVPLGRFFIEINQPDCSCQFSIISYLKPIPLDKSYTMDEELVYKIIQLTPKYIIANSTPHKLKISQLNAVVSIILEPFERRPFFWQNKDKPKQFRVSSFDSSSFWGYSGSINVTDNSQTFTLRKAQDTTQLRILTSQLQHNDHLSYINISEQGSKYLLENTVPDVRLIVYQNEIYNSDEVIQPNKLLFNVDYGQKIPFGYEFPSKHRKLTAQIGLLGKQFDKMYCEPVEIDLQGNLFQKQIMIIRGNKQKTQKTFLLKLEFEGANKKLILLNQARIAADDEPQLEIIFKANRVGLSVIGEIFEKRIQLLFLHINNIYLQRVQTEQNQQLVLRIEKIRLQNMRATKVLFPITFECQSSPGIQFRLQRNRHNERLIQYIGLSITKSALLISSEQIKIIYENIKELSYANQIATDIKEEIIMDYRFATKELSKQTEKYYFVMAEIYPVKIKVSFKNLGNWGGRIFKTFGNINQSTLKVDGMVTKHFTCKDIPDFMAHILKHYKENILGSLLPILGNISILGNPISLVSRVGSGFKDLIVLPAEGFEKSALEGGKGIARGTRSLFKNTFQGAFNSVEAITDTIGSGFASFVDDQDFQRERQKLRNQRSEHVFQGLFQGGKSIINGIGNGIIGIVKDPLEGAQRNGIGGFFMGGLKGITGLVLKPVSGILDATTKTAEGIKNTANYLNPKQRQRKMTRLRLSRVFYSNNRQYRGYDNELASISLALALQQQQFEQLCWYHSYKLEGTVYLLLTHEYIIIYEIKQEKIVKHYDCRMITYCSEDIQDKDKMKLRIIKGHKEGELNLTVKENRKKLVADIQNIIDAYSNEV